MSERRPLVMKLSLNVLQHLGLNLYSNVPAVLSEVVANAFIQQRKLRLAELRSRESELAEELGDLHPDLIAARSADDPSVGDGAGRRPGS